MKIKNKRIKLSNAEELKRGELATLLKKYKDGGNIIMYIFKR